MSVEKHARLVVAISKELKREGGILEEDFRRILVKYGLSASLVDEAVPHTASSDIKASTEGGQCEAPVPPVRPSPASS